MNEEILIRCRFSRGGFSHERKFMIDAPGGGYYTGIAPIHYCYDRDHKEFESIEMPIGMIVEGFMDARILSNDDNIFTIHVPDGGVCDVAPDVIIINGVAHE